MLEQTIIQLANFYGLKILPPNASEHQFIDENGNSQPLTIDKWAQAIGFPYYKDSDFDENSLSESIILPTQFVAIDKQTLSSFQFNNILEFNIDIVEYLGNTQYAMAA